MLPNNRKGISLVKLLVAIVIIGVLVAAMFMLINNEKAQTRDAKRLADVARLQAAFELLHHDTASYAPAAENGCQQGMAVNRCNLAAYLPSIGQFKDPGKFSYLVTKTPADDEYEVTFYLERTYYNLKAGRHTVSEAGIR